MVSKIVGLKPSLREKKRYVVYQCLSDKPTDAKAVCEEIQRKMLSFLGEYGYGKAGVMFMQDQENKGVIKVNNAFVDHVKTALLEVTEVDHHPVIVSSVGVSGILNKAIAKFT